ncbi:GroES-like protein [Dichomitus squalens]|uniref:GroES-like protein n=2 Tax=Dichomitus squalens TaxID=114155 RepID=A0A4Q9PFK8_9APHY|nr:GroES-like protein [Dichomitus squalens LYAD-421 SS1]EJF58192.1 GroES-like protein [Dichomitus squalens LYAD-421 SS1]TBU36966.1 GroES-like protein [Dichomitus squalens]TBU53784.1 GroES-like protein [Dichomitus squalens]
MSTQKALILPEKQGEWKVVDVPIPTPGPKDVLVKVVATALNPVDWKIKEYGYFVSDYPFVGGTDGAGIVEQVGSEVSNLAKGDKILFQGWFTNDKATFQQYTIVPAEITAKIPENISFDQAASVPLGLATVTTGLWNHHPDAKSASLVAPYEEGGETTYAGKPAVILGGSSSVGQYAIQAARLSKFSPIITTASPHNEALLKSLGATHVLDRSLPASTLAAEVAKIAGGKPVEFVYDAISLADTQALGYDVLAPGGVLFLTLPVQIPEDKRKAGDKKIVNVFGNVHSPENRQLGVEQYSRLTEWLKTGAIVPNKVEVLPNGLAGIPEGLERLKNNKVSGTKLIGHPQETA